MTPDEQRIAIAEACGWTSLHLYEGFGLRPGWIHGENGTPLPDYLNDLNAMHEVEKVLNRSQRIKFVGELCGLVGVKWKPTSHFDTIHATAAQRAEAFLRTIGKWK